VSSDKGIETEKKHMKGKITVLTLCAMLSAPCSFAEAQQQSKIPKIGWLGARTPSAPGGGPGTGAELFRREFSKIGYIEGKNITIEYRYADDQLDRLPGLVDELLRLKIDVLIAPTTVEASAAKNATRTIPIVFFNVPDPVASGLVDSLAQPGGNITAFTTISAVLAGKRLELLKETVPNLSRVAVLWDPQNPAAAQQWKESQLPAREMGLQLHSMEVSSFNKFESAFKEAVKARSAALAVTQNTLVASNQTRVMELTAKNRLPAMYTNGTYVANGALMSYGPDQAESFRRAASMVDKILKGTKPADIPVEQPTKFEFVINLKAAKQIGLTIPPNVLARADKVIR
jgi:putative tryptophan/tyrosine transport system substrate-binding protein